MQTPANNTLPLAPRWTFDCFYGWIGQLQIPVALAFESGFQGNELVAVELTTDGASELEIYSSVGTDTEAFLEDTGGERWELDDCVAFALDPLHTEGLLQPSSVTAGAHDEPMAELECAVCAVCGCEDCQVVSCEDVRLAARNAA